MKLNWEIYEDYDSTYLRAVIVPASKRHAEYPDVWYQLHCHCEPIRWTSNLRSVEGSAWAVEELAYAVTFYDALHAAEKHFDDNFEGAG